MRRSKALCLCALVLTAGCGANTVRPAAAPISSITVFGQKNEHAPRELDVFSFLVGKWEGTGKTLLSDGSAANFTVAWIGRYILDGMAIADEFHSSAPDGSPYLGISFRQYIAAKRNWVVEYLDVSNSLLRRQVNETSGSVEVRGNTVVVTSRSSSDWSRELYTVESHEWFDYRLDLSKDGGHSWTTGQIEMQLKRMQ